VYRQGDVDGVDTAGLAWRAWRFPRYARSTGPVDNVLEVYRGPVADPDTPYGWRYSSTETLRAGDPVNPLAVPSARIAVADLLL